MQPRNGIEQGRLRRMEVHWGPHQRQHLAVVPIFNGGYKVLGMVGLDAEGPPIWYPGVPLVVEPRRLVFKSSLSDAPPDWSEVEPGLLEDCYFHDPWGAIQSLVPEQPGAPSLEGSANLVGCRIQGRMIEDVVFEPALHRVRAIRLSGRWGRSRVVPVLRLPALRECLQRTDAPPLDVTAFGPPPKRPEGWTSRFLRMLVQPLLTDEPRQR